MLNEHSVLAYDVLSEGMPLGVVAFAARDEAILDAALAGHPELRRHRQSGIEPALLAGNHLALIFNSYRIDSAIHASTKVTLVGAADRRDIVAVRGTVAEMEVRRERHFIVIESETVDRDGTVVATESNTLVIPSTAGKSA
jgi:hypothetical protein